MGSDTQFQIPEPYRAWCHLCSVGFLTEAEAQQHDKDNLERHRVISAGGKPETKQVKVTGSNLVGRLLVGKTAMGAVEFVGVCVSYTEVPTVKVRCPDGTEVSWVAQLCEVVELSKEALEKLLPMK